MDANKLHPAGVPWDNFPPVIRHENRKNLPKGFDEPVAKKGDDTATLPCAPGLVTAQTVDSIRHLIRNKPATIMPVLAKEEAANNQISVAMADVLVKRLGLGVDDDPLQAANVGCTGKGVITA